MQLKSLYTPLTYQDFYGNKPDLDKLKASLAKLDKQTLLEYALTLLHNAESWSNIDDFIKHFFSEENEELVQKSIFQLYKKYISELNKTSCEIIPQIVILTKHSCLEFLRVIFSVDFTGEELSDNTFVKLVIFNWLLVINEKTTQRPILPMDLDEDMKMAYEALLIITSYNDFTNINVAENFTLQCHKSRLLFNFLDKHKNLQRIKEMYLKEIGCKCWEEYIFVLAKLFILDHQDKSTSTRIILEKNHPSYHHDKKILEQFAFSSDVQIPHKENVDFISFRNKPLIRLNENTYWVIDKTFVANRLYRSLFFGLKAQNDIIDEQYKQSNFFQFFTTNFSEETLFYDVMKHIIGKKSYIHHSGAEMRRIGLSGEPDYYVRNENDIFLFEFKDSLYRKEDKVDRNYENVKSSIEDKLVHKNNGKSSAIEQLCNNIDLILNDKFHIDSEIRSNKVNIYPILVVGDPTFTNVGINYILNDYFRIKISNRKIENENIRPLILVSIDSLIVYQFEFEENKLNLRNVLDSYLEFLNMKTPYMINDISRNIMHRYFSLDQYLRDKVPLKSKKSLLEPLINAFREIDLT